LCCLGIRFDSNCLNRSHDHNRKTSKGRDRSQSEVEIQIRFLSGNEIASIPDWDERVARIAEEAPNWNIGAIAGIPSWVLLMLRKVIDVNNLKTIHDIWLNLTVYSSGGAA
jgi:hypothetical protein